MIKFKMQNFFEGKKMVNLSQGQGVKTTLDFSNVFNGKAYRDFLKAPRRVLSHPIG